MLEVRQEDRGAAPTHSPLKHPPRPHCAIQKPNQTIWAWPWNLLCCTTDAKLCEGKGKHMLWLGWQNHFCSCSWDALRWLWMETWKSDYQLSHVPLQEAGAWISTTEGLCCSTEWGSVLLFSGFAQEWSSFGISMWTLTGVTAQTVLLLWKQVQFSWPQMFSVSVFRLFWRPFFPQTVSHSKGNLIWHKYVLLDYFSTNT